ncbi:hypothetical protein VNO77_39653 [Canavalia gladiata]|uniref:Uncharacterized protein n=1 Tax=Canavalia gladiata TaxID=3824 RepID=A0AAN9JWS6_CANGL
MEDVITEAAPPSRLLEEDLNIFTPPSTPLPSPFLLFPPHHSEPLEPTLLIIALSPPSLSLFHHFPNKTLLASLILPELSLSLNNHHTPTLHSLSPSTILASIPSPVAPHRAHALAKILLSDRIRPESVLVLDSVDPRNYRGRLSSDETVAFKLETSAERKRTDKDKLLDNNLEYYPSGSVVDGLGAAILARCQVLNVRASLCVSWPQFDASVVSLIKDLLQRRVLRGFDLDFGLGDHEVLKFGRSKDHRLRSEFMVDSSLSLKFTFSDLALSCRSGAIFEVPKSSTASHHDILVIVALTTASSCDCGPQLVSNGHSITLTEL